MQLSCIYLFLHLYHNIRKVMKPIILTISFYFLFLALHPCSCNTQIIESFRNKTEKVSNIHGENDSLHEICTPFCACSSFHNPNFIIKDSFDLVNMDTDPVKKIAIYNENTTSPHLDSFWRPPKA